MNARHVIETMDFALADAGPETGLHDEQALARLLREQLLPAVEQALEACDEPGTVLALPVLELDLGTIPPADFHAEAARRLREALLDALDGARRRASGSALATGIAETQATLHGETERLLAQLASFLDTGRLPWHAGVGRTDAHVALLDQLLGGGAPRLRAMLAVALAQPHAARRLAEQFPLRQLRALVMPGAAPGTADAGAADGTAAHRLVAVLRDELTGAARLGRADGDGDPVPALAAFLRSGRLPPADVALAGNDAQVPAHVRLFERALHAPVATLRAMLRAALADPDSARRLLDQYPSEQLAALVRRCAPTHAATLLARLAPDAASPDWRGLLAACLLDDGAPAAPAAADIARLAAFLDDGAPLAGAATVLERLIVAHDGAGPLHRVLQRAAADAAAIDRLVRGVPAATLLYVAERLAPAPAQRGAAWAQACLAEAVQAGAGSAQLRALAQRCWRHVLLATLLDAPLPSTADALAAAVLRFASAAPARALPAAQAALEDLSAYLESGLVPGGLGRTATLLVEQVLAARPSSQALATTLARMLATRQAVRRLLDGVPAPLLERLAALAAPERAAQVLGTVRERYAAVRDRAGSAALARLDAVALEGALVALLCRRDAGTALPPAVTAVPAGADARTRLLSFLASGRMIPAPGMATPAALLDAVLAGADAALWPALAQALAAPAALRRLLEQFPERQWQALVRAAQPVQGQALCLLADMAGATAAARQRVWSVLLPAAMASPGMPLVPAALRAELGALAPADGRADAATRLVRWLHTGQAGTEGATGPAALLAAAMCGDPLRLRAALTAALARPAAARRLATLVPQGQLEALFWLAAPAAAADAIDAVDAARALAVARGADEERAAAVAARCRHGAVGSLLAGAPAPLAVMRTRLHAMVDDETADRRASARGHRPRSQLERLAVFLATGRFDLSGADGEEADHVGLLDELLAAPAATLVRVLADALARPASRRRLIEQFPDGQLLAVLGFVHRAVKVYRPPAADVPAIQQRLAFWRDLVALVLGAGPGDLAVTGAGSAAPLERLLDPDCIESMTAPDARAALAALLADPAQWALLVERLPEQRLWHIVRLAQAASHQAAPAPRTEPSGAADGERAACWQALLSAPPPAWEIGRAGRPALAAAGIASAPGRAAAHVACMDALLAAPGPALWTLLASALAHPGHARRLVTRFPARQLDVLAGLAPAAATAIAQARATFGTQAAAAMMQPGVGEAGTAPAQAGKGGQQESLSGIAASGLAPVEQPAEQASPRCQAPVSGSEPRKQVPDTTGLPQAGGASGVRPASLTVLPIAPADSQAGARLDALDLAAFSRKEGHVEPLSGIAASDLGPLQHPAEQASPRCQAPVSGSETRKQVPDTTDFPQTGGASGVGPASLTVRPITPADRQAGARLDALDLAASGPTADEAEPPRELLAFLAAYLARDDDIDAALAPGHTAHQCHWRPVRPGRAPGTPKLPAVRTQAAPDLGAEGRSVTAAGTAPDTAVPVLARTDPLAMQQPPGVTKVSTTLAAAAPPTLEACETRPAIGTKPEVAHAPTPAPWRSTPADNRNARLVRIALRAIQAAEPGARHSDATRQQARYDSACAALARAAAGTGAAARNALIAALLSGVGASAEQAPWSAATLRSVAAGPGTRALLAAHLPEATLAGLVAMLRPGQPVPAPPPGSAEPARQRHWRDVLGAAVARHERAAEPAAPAPAPLPQAAPQVTMRPPEPLPEGERLALLNAGLVLLAPYLPRLFGVLGLVADGAFTDTAAAERAALLLQFAVTGVASAPEYQLPLNKLMCGLAAEAPLPLAIDITEQERATLASLLDAMIATWSALGRTSIDGFREAFLVRQGELLRGEEDWSLSVVPGPFDMLMDRLPWSFSIIRYPWMKQPIHVTWQRT